MNTLIDMNSSRHKNMREHREAEFKALCLKTFRDNVENNSILLSTYAKEYEKKQGIKLWII